MTHPAAPMPSPDETPAPLAPSPAAALANLFATGQASLEVPSGADLTADAVSLDGERVRATVPRLAVAVNMEVAGRIVDEMGEPWKVTLAIDAADYHSPQLASVELRVLEVSHDTTRRRTRRVPAGGRAWLVAVSCQEVVDGDRVEGTMVDLSRGGVGFATSRVLRRGDRLFFHGRFFADKIDAEVRVAVVRPGSAPGRSIVGCSFIDMDAANAAQLERILNGSAARPSTAVDTASLRELVAEKPAGWRRVFRRS
jgi:hypothetical protein